MIESCAPKKTGACRKVVKTPKNEEQHGSVKFVCT
jgi:hypothetical protein